VLGGFGVSGTPTVESVTVWWDAATDNVGVAGYAVYRDGAAVTTLTAAARNYVFGGLACGTAYTLGLDAYDARGNRSARKSVTATTAACSAPPPPVDDELVPRQFEWGWTEEIVRPQTLVRCKRQEWREWFSLFWKKVDALVYEGSFRVCYVPGQRIDSVTYVRGDAIWTQVGLTWLGNDQGYPRFFKSTYQVVFEWRGSISTCIVQAACVVKKHPWVKITFYANNTMTEEVGVA
jgi:hypothetical protein